MFNFSKPKLSLNELFKRRHSTRAFSPRPVLHNIVSLLIEAARWAPSSSNVQPWRFIVIDGSDRVLRSEVHETLDEGNYWAKQAPVLIIALAKVTKKDGSHNAYAKHDLGLATENMLLQATDLGLIAHPMGGFNKDVIRKLFRISEEYEVMTITAYGYPGDYKNYSEEIYLKDSRERKRKELEQIVFYNEFNQ
jgi:nitroreductase